MKALNNWVHTSRATNESEDNLSATGVSILGSKAESIARKAGMEKGDIIVEYDGKGNLTTDKLAALTTVTKPESTQVRVVFMRDGRERSAQVSSGPLGISVLDTTLQASSEPRESSDRIQRITAILMWISMFFACSVFFVVVSALIVPVSWYNKVFVVFLISVAAAWLAQLAWGLGISIQYRVVGSSLGSAIGMAIAYSIGKAVWGPDEWNWAIALVSISICVAIGAYLGYKVVDKKSMQ